MLDRNKLVFLLDQISGQLFSGQETDQAELAVQTWQAIAGDQSFSGRVTESESSFLLPKWHGSLSEITENLHPLSEYTVLGVDGSQVYPERHLAGVGCFVVNTGGCLLQYGQKSSVEFFSVPQVFMPEKLAEDFGHFSLDMVDLQREALEFSTAFDRSTCAIGTSTHLGIRKPFVFLFDGSIIFWHLEGKPQEVRDAFLRVYFDSLQKFYDKAIVIGPKVENFRDIVACFKDSHAIVQVEDVPAFQKAIRDLCADPSKREVLGVAAKEVIAANKGATRRSLERLAELIK